MVLAAAAALFAVWLGTHFSRLSSDQNGLLRFALGGLYALLILLRPKPAGGERHPPGWLAPWLAGLGTLLAVNAIIFDVNQFEWLGLLLLLYAALLWALPPRFRRDAGLALLLVYWVHPLPGQIFGPLEYLMQRMSVIGTERLLHAINFHVWGDGLVLRTGFRNFLVPEECSGMKTAVTVLLCSLGTGVLLRLRGIETITLIAVGLVQVLLLNILRIFVTVRVGVNMSPEWASNFLHRTVTIFLLIAVVGVHLEASAWRAWRRRRGQRDAVLARVEKEKKQMRVPPFWRVVFAWTPRVLPVLVIAAAAAFLVYKSRPVHRSHMISAMLDGLILTDPATAERAVEAALRLTPGEPNLLTARVRALLQRRRHQQALEELRRMPEGARGIYQRVLEAQALVGLGRTPEAYFVVESLPPESKNWPIVAMLMAELAATTDQPESAAENVVKASRDIRLCSGIWPCGSNGLRFDKPIRLSPTANRFTP
jgi:exosortase/archaeosortase family protein